MIQLALGGGAGGLRHRQHGDGRLHRMKLLHFFGSGVDGSGPAMVRGPSEPRLGMHRGGAKASVPPRSHVCDYAAGKGLSNTAAECCVLKSEMCDNLLKINFRNQ